MFDKKDKKKTEKSDHSMQSVNASTTAGDQIDEADDVEKSLEEVEAKPCVENAVSDGQSEVEDAIDSYDPAVRKSKRRKRHIKKIVAFVAVITAIAVAASVIWYFVRKSSSSTSDTQSGMPSQFAGQDLDLITASGTTSVGMVLDEFDLDVSDVELEIEEVYISSRDEVAEGDKILKISDDSIEAARTALEQAAGSAEYAYNLNEIEAKADTITAANTRDQALAELDYAQQDYDDTVAEAQAKIDDLNSQIEDQNELVTEYQAAVYDPNYYYDKYEVNDLYTQLQEDFDRQMALYADTSNGIANKVSFVSGSSSSSSSSGSSATGTSTSGGTSGGGGAPGGSGSGATTSQSILVEESSASESDVVSEDVTTDSSSTGTSGTAPTTSGSTSSSSGSSTTDATLSDTYVSSSSSSGTSTSGTTSAKSYVNSNPLYAGYVLLQAEVEEEETAYNEAKTNAEEDTANAPSLLGQAQNKLESLQLQLKSAQTNLTTVTEEAKETLNTVTAEANAASDTYDTSIRSIENTEDTLKDAMDVADENLEEFESTIGDGYLYTSTSGTIMMVGVSSGDTLSSGTMVAAYTDTSTMSVTASVDQGDIASIEVGDACLAVTEDSVVYDGTVTAINPVTQSSSKTSVTYSVVVTLDGDVSDLEENTSVTTYFGDDLDTAKQMLSGGAK
jgi:multidrug resistance efflux pump